MAALTSSRATKQQLLERISDLEQLKQALEERLELHAQEQLRLQSGVRLHERLEANLRQANERFELLVRLNKHVNSLNLDKIFEVCVTRIPYLLNAHYASVYTYDPGERRLHLRKHSHHRAIEHVIDLGEHASSLMAQVVRTGKIRVVADLDDAPRPSEQEPTEPDRPHRQQYASRSCIVAPLCVGDEVLGVLNLSDPIDGRPFSESKDQRLVAQIAEMLALGIRNCLRFAALEERAQTDSLTRLVNHQTFFEILEREVRRASRYGGELTVVMLDIDDFKFTNDNTGHLAGDLVLREIAAIVRESVRATDTAARYGGDEFALILPQSDLAAATVVAERIRERVARHPFAFGGTELRARVSLGMCALDEDMTASDLVRSADQALYRAKSQGGDRLVVQPRRPAAAGELVPKPKRTRRASKRESGGEGAADAADAADTSAPIGDAPTGGPDLPREDAGSA